ncbi:hypothetical protein OE749_01955 [Aestuariibacter sp. AA17]|uniref:Uncharacterized protein n=1 Tax=Fluctibacter corallii TaxID=2984329 RepID=A0ABT3A4A9_9ALTE|nr:hypothetical protein [Aestuariibacter sp. AA17]MCV2883460.1 hypothetical protein [Aestuariibacter sp. AA17]
MVDSPATRNLINEESFLVRQALGEQFEWRWDNHHNALLTEFSVDHEHHVLETLKQYFPNMFNRKTIKRAQLEIKHKAGNFAKLNHKQQLLIQDDTASNNIMVAWWPWGHGATVSVRIFRTNTAPCPDKKSFWSRLFN